MSNFEPETAGPSELERARKLINQITKHPELWNSAGAWMAWNASSIEASSITLPYSSIAGGSLFTPQVALVLTAEDLTGTTDYSNLATSGPEITGLPAGTYLAAWACYAYDVSGGPGVAYMSLSINGSDAGDGIAMQKPSARDATLVNFYTGTLTAGTNAVKARYRIGDAGMTTRFASRSLLLIRTSI